MVTWSGSDLVRFSGREKWAVRNATKETSGLYPGHPNAGLLRSAYISSILMSIAFALKSIPLPYAQDMPPHG